MSRTASQIRQDFIDFFKSKEHTFVPSAPVVPQDDPTLMFTNAGMNQFKAIFLGDNPRGLTRAANSQKCMRVSGKHNDLEEVGRDHYHHTFFEMLGNWSFGNYYKKEALPWAWELLTSVWKLDKSKLYATVYKSDDEAFELWKTATDIDHAHISRHGEKDNFWEMGETGPCGPCSEIHIDCGEGTCTGLANGHTCGPNAPGCSRFMEIWNNVFIQYNREKDGSLKELPAKHVDTGMGFERIVRIIQGKKSNYDIDIFATIIGAIEKLCGKKYSPAEEGTPFRVIADHIRSLTFSITDGAFPSNDGRGYVVRRLLRRAYRFGRELGFNGPFLYKLVAVVVKEMGSAFPEITQRQSYVEEVIRNEESRFGQTLEQGIEKFNTLIDTAKKSGLKQLDGAGVFLLYDTFGFPVDLTRLMAEELGFGINEEEYRVCMEEQRKRGRDAKDKEQDIYSADGWTDLVTGSSTTFVGYENCTASVKILRYKPLVVEGQFSGYLLVLTTTPFYGESGGQVGDTGSLVSENTTALIVTNTVKINDIIIHHAQCTSPLTDSELKGTFTAQVTLDARQATRRNHSATHLLQAALRKVLGDHVTQSGSRVDPFELRFDFSHFKALSSDEIIKIETMVNGWVLACLPVTCELQSIEQAKKEGAMALFGEKYGDTVRVVTMGASSKELCGGTHVSNTGEIGMIHITQETSISAGVRRIVGVTGLNTHALLVSKEQILAQSAAILKSGESALVERITQLLDTVKHLETELAQAKKAAAAGQVAELLGSALAAGAVAAVVKNFGNVEKESFTVLCDALSDSVKNAPADGTGYILGGICDGACMFFACAGKKMIDTHKFHSGKIVKEIAALCGGNGGGSPARAQAGGKDPAALPAALDKATQLIKALS